jgi:hypothetical protein
VNRLIERIKYQIGNMPGWRTNRKLVVIESDDWGSIRMPSREVYDSLVSEGVPLYQSTYNRFDSLACEEDLASLFEVLLSVRDINGNPAKITANTIVANPDFEKIEESGFSEYHYEKFTETLKKYPSHQNSFSLWKEGIDAGVFRPQFHGREHIHVPRWMKALQQEESVARKIFKYKMYDLSIGLERSESSFMEALQVDSEEDFAFQHRYISEGLKLFEDIFGFPSKTFIAPCYVWHDKLNDTLQKGGVQGFQGSWYQLEPNVHDNSLKKIFHYLGERNKNNQVYLTRNVFFEPAEIQIDNWVKEVLTKMRLAFRAKKPAIIQSHRMNFIGFIDKKNRENNLTLFSEVLQQIIKTWPDVEFVSSDELSEIMKKSM